MNIYKYWGSNEACIIVVAEDIQEARKLMKEEIGEFEAETVGMDDIREEDIVEQPLVKGVIHYSRGDNFE